MMRLPKSVAIIGRLLDLYYDAGDGRARKVRGRGLVLCAAPDYRTLYVWPAPTSQHRKPLSSFPQARAVYQTWTEFDADEVLEGRPRLGTETTRLGTMLRIGYRSDKWSRARRQEDYEHQYTSAVVLSECGDVLRIRGGHQRVTADGIRG